MATRRAVVIGGGQMGIATSLALCRSQWHTTLVLRDKTSVDVVSTDRALRGFAPVQSFPLPPNLCVIPAAAADAENSNKSGRIDECLGNSNVMFICTPSSALVDVAPLAAKIQNGGSVVVCSRGLASNGASPCDVVAAAVGAKDVRLVTATGPLFAKECATVSSSSQLTVSPLTYGLSRRLPALHQLFTGPGAPRCVYVSEEDHGDHHESTVALEQLVGLTNGLSLIAAVGAGMVANEFPGSVSAQASYQLHCVQAVTEVLTAALRAYPTAAACVNPHSPLLLSTLTAACYHLGSREYAFGRTLDFNFRRKDALSAHFRRGCLHQKSLDETCDGVFATLARLQLSSPFLSSICDAYLCVHRASAVGRHLVRIGEYEWLEALSLPSPLVGHMQALDEAVAADDAPGLERAKARLAEAMAAPATS